MEKLITSLFVVPAIVFVFASTFKPASKASQVCSIRYTVYGVDYMGVSSGELPYDMTATTEPLNAQEWVDEFGSFFLDNFIDEGVMPIELDNIRSTYCDESIGQYICLVQIATYEDVPVFVARNSGLGVNADCIFGDFSPL